MNFAWHINSVWCMNLPLTGTWSIIVRAFYFPEKKQPSLLACYKSSVWTVTFVWFTILARIVHWLAVVSFYLMKFHTFCLHFVNKFSAKYLFGSFGLNVFFLETWNNFVYWLRIVKTFTVIVVLWFHVQTRKLYRLLQFLVPQSGSRLWNLHFIDFA